MHRYATLAGDSSAERKSLHERADPRFYWNKHLTQKLVGGPAATCLPSLSDSLALACLHVVQTMTSL